ncbi:class IIb bacteriocin, lactobin A/cerein 7B family [Collimonas sp. OK242]|jgi:lactobin A/cerein 7B family class IIb bacteriocin|uniref:class IIb bacteriocin, lactobin A/cerein 7B family n=1 Tax=Collimonas sp. OK242 TaxID=1798195 RepID=UPI000B818EB9|nr:class IIb bacteriocin, lactobin A/cerein 7B family [Collimonas sp. OK242]
MKKSALVMVLSTMIVSPAIAMESKVSAFDDTQQIFRIDSQPLELSLLSQQEMKETEGGVLPVAVAGAIGGAAVNTIIYAGTSLANGRPMTWTGAGIAAGSGALIGSGGNALMLASGGGLAANLAWRPAMIAANDIVQRVGNGLACTGQGPCILPK